MFFDQKAIGAFTFQAVRALGAQRGQRPVLSALCKLCGQGRNDRRPTASRRVALSGVKEPFSESRSNGVSEQRFSERSRRGVRGKGPSMTPLFPPKFPPQKETLGNACLEQLLMLY